MYTFKDELNFFYQRFISKEKDFSTLKNWAKPILYPAWIVRSVLVSLVILLLFPLFDLYFFYHEELSEIHDAVMESMEKDLAEFSTMFQQK